MSMVACSTPYPTTLSFTSYPKIKTDNKGRITYISIPNELQVYKFLYNGNEEEKERFIEDAMDLGIKRSKIEEIINSNMLAVEKESYLMMLIHENKRISIDVPTYRQEGAANCGLACARMVLEKAGYSGIKEGELSAIVKKPDNVYKDTKDIEKVLNTYLDKKIKIKYDPFMKKINPNELMEYLKEARDGKKLLPILNTGGHFCVVNGLRKEKGNWIISYIDPLLGKPVKSDIRKLENPILNYFI